MNKEIRLLVFRFSSLGDVALAVPVIMAVLEQNPQVSVDFVTPEFMHDLFPEHERLKLHGFDKKSKHKGLKGLYQLLNSLKLDRYDAIVDLHDVLRTQFISTLSKLNRKKVIVIDKDRKQRNRLLKGKTAEPLRHTTEKYADAFRKLGLKAKLDGKLTNYLFPEYEKRKNIGIAPFARHQGKRMETEKLKKVAEQLAKTYPVKIFGAKKELDSLEYWREIKNVELVHSANLKEDLQKMAELQVMISMDSANMHLACLVGVPVVSVWGVTHPNAGFLGYGQDPELVIQDETLSWRPTSVYGNKAGPKDNPNGMKNISAELIVKKVKQVLDEK